MKQKSALSGLVLICVTIAAILIIPTVVRNDKISPSPTPQIQSQETRQPAVAGQFYPQNLSELNSQLDSFLNQTEKLNARGQLRILIVPHAGTEYSGQTAAWGFKQLEGTSYSRIILLGPSHQVPLNHAAVYPDGIWKTPLGSAAIDETGVSMLLSEEQNIVADKTAHAGEHSLELELIFLQKVLENFDIIPVLLGQPSDLLIENLAQKISRLIDEHTLLVVSTDLSHYPDWQTANQVDEQVIEAILAGNKSTFEKTIKNLEDQNYPQLDTCTCGYEPLRVALRVAELLSISNFKEIKYENSGDVTDNKERVVGYAAIGAWSEKLPSSQLDSKTQKEALEIARETVTEYLTNQQIPAVKSQNQALLQPLGAFVTLKKNHQLRGCIGEFEPNEPLYQVIQNMAIAAATKDQRFTPVNASELADIEIEISVLTPRQKISDWQKIELGKHGVVIEKDSRSGTFLPQVATENDWSKEEFLGQLCSQKAKLPPNCYQDPSVRLYVFEAQVFEE